jgi:hypothetical protein
MATRAARVLPDPKPTKFIGRRAFSSRMELLPTTGSTGDPDKAARKAGLVEIRY